jgi:DNA-directed RNA polymerase subunit RPC12/RpoP
MAVLCSNCSGRLIFNPATQQLECAACGSKFYPEDVQDINADVHSKYYDTRVYTCAHCGAEVITSDTEVSTFCVYCGNPSINFTRISKECRPDGIVPFQITKEQAVESVKKKFLKNPIIPKEVKAKAVPENFRGIYVPYWVINARFSETDYLSGMVKNDKRDEKRYYQRAGTCSFANVPIDGSSILNDEVSMKLEPFIFNGAKDFDEDYLNGFYSNTSDMTYTGLRESAANRCHKLFADEALTTIPGKKQKLEDSIYWIDIQDDPLYMMMPVWFFTFNYKDKPYTILVNGQTGKVVGTMPWEEKRIYGIGWSLFILFLAVLGTGFVCIALNYALLSGLFNYIITVVIALGTALLVPGIVGINKIVKNLRLTQSDAIFKFVKKRQA